MEKDKPDIEEFCKEYGNDLDLSNQDIKALVLSSGLNLKTYNDLCEKKKERKKKYLENKSKLTEINERKWLTRHGKKDLIQFDDKQLHEFKQYFLSLDEDKSGSIGVEELEEPLISLGIAQSASEVKKIVASIDDDGQIEFNEFLGIIVNSKHSKNGKNAGIVEFFKDLIAGKLAGGTVSNKLSFKSIISTIRRKKFLSAIMSKDEKQKNDGMRVLISYAKFQAGKQKDQKGESQSPQHTHASAKFGAEEKNQEEKQRI